MLIYFASPSMGLCAGRRERAALRNLLQQLPVVPTCLGRSRSAGALGHEELAEQPTASQRDFQTFYPYYSNI